MSHLIPQVYRILDSAAFGFGELDVCNELVIQTIERLQWANRVLWRIDVVEYEDRMNIVKERLEAQFK
jgi:hypothetical protein